MSQLQYSGFSRSSPARIRAFRLLETSPRTGCHTIQVEGELDLAVVDQLRSAIQRASENDRILIDLAGCEFIDSTAIAALIGAYKEKLRDGGLAVYGCANQVRRVLSLTGLTENGLVYDSAEEAMASES